MTRYPIKTKRPIPQGRWCGSWFVGCVADGLQMTSAATGASLHRKAAQVAALPFVAHLSPDHYQDNQGYVYFDGVELTWETQYIWGENIVSNCQYIWGDSDGSDQNV